MGNAERARKDSSIWAVTRPAEVHLALAVVPFLFGSMSGTGGGEVVDALILQPSNGNVSRRQRVVSRYSINASKGKEFAVQVGVR
jgi:hypothetical protein